MRQGSLTYILSVRRFLDTRVLLLRIEAGLGLDTSASSGNTASTNIVV